MVLIGLLYFVVFYSDVDNDLTSAKQNEGRLTGQLTEAETSREEYQKDADEKTRREQQAREQKKILPDDPETPDLPLDDSGRRHGLGHQPHLVEPDRAGARWTSTPRCP